MRALLGGGRHAQAAWAPRAGAGCNQSLHAVPQCTAVELGAPEHNTQVAGLHAGIDTVTHGTRRLEIAAPLTAAPIKARPAPAASLCAAIASCPSARKAAFSALRAACLAATRSLLPSGRAAAGGVPPVADAISRAAPRGRGARSTALNASAAASETKKQYRRRSLNGVVVAPW